MIKNIKQYYKKIIIVLLGLMALISVLQGAKNAVQYSHDFQYDAVKTLVLGMNPYDESLEPSKELMALGFEPYYGPMEANQFPSLLLLLTPYTYFSPTVVKWVWMFCNLIFTGLLIYFLRQTFFKTFSGENYLILVLFMLSGTPWRNQIGVGQHSIFAFVFFVIAVYLAEAARDSQTKSGLYTAGAAAALCLCYFKYTLTLPVVLYFVYKRWIKEIVISVIPHILLTALAAWWLKDTFLNMIKKPLEVASWLSSEGAIDMGSLLGGGGKSIVITAIGMLLLLIMMWFMPEGYDGSVIALLTLWSLVITYHRIYDFFVIIMAFAFVPAGIGLKKYLKIPVKWQLGFLMVLSVWTFYIQKIFDNYDSYTIFAVLYYIYLIVVTVQNIRLLYLRRASKLK